MAGEGAIDSSVHQRRRLPPAAPVADNAGKSASGAPNAIDVKGGAAGTSAPIYQRWWFWAGVGGAVAIGVAGALWIRSDASYTKTGSIGTLGGAK
jgi:hypothetical protein